MIGYLNGQAGFDSFLKTKLSNMYTTYVLYSQNFDRIYIGLTNNLERRFKEHNAERNKSTKAYCPWEIVHTEKFETRIEARKREKYLKSYRGRKYIRDTVLLKINKKGNRTI